MKPARNAPPATKPPYAKTKQNRSRAPISAQVAAMLCEGETTLGIAARLKIGRGKARSIVESDEVREEIERINREVRRAAQQHGVVLIGQVSRVWAEAMTAEAGCAECGAHRADHTTRLRAADTVADRFGLPKTTIQELASSLPLSDKSEEELERLVLEEAASILERRGSHALAGALRSGELPLLEVVGG